MTRAFIDKDLNITIVEKEPKEYESMAEFPMVCKSDGHIFTAQVYFETKDDEEAFSKWFCEKGYKKAWNV